jgi:TonB family protein
MNIQKISSAKNLLLFSAIAGLVGLSSCDMNGKDNKNDAAYEDSIATAKRADSIATVTAKKVRKPKVSLAKADVDNNKLEKDKDGVYNKAETMPMYPGGQDALQTFVENTVNYPQQAVDQNAEGTVRVSFIVDEKGNVVKPSVISGTNANSALDEEALRVVQQMPKWKPGVVKGKAVKTRLSLPITFQLES